MTPTQEKCKSSHKATACQATSSITKPTFSESGVYPKTVKITFPSGCGSTYTCSYKKDNGSSVTVKSTTANVSFDNHGSLVAYVSDGTNTVNSSYTVTIKLKAADLSYDNTNTSLPCEDAQCALDEFKKKLE